MRNSKIRTSGPSTIATMCRELADLFFLLMSGRYYLDFVFSSYIINHASEISSVMSA